MSHRTEVEKIVLSPLSPAEEGRGDFVVRACRREAYRYYYFYYFSTACGAAVCFTPWGKGLER